ncbi:MAG: HAD family phosphatase [Actinobacteria bacterium]|nr:HAD family phosphatase [Actinomycetota bacterium]
MTLRANSLEAVVFDLDGVLIDSEHVWAAARNQLTVERGGRSSDEAELDMMGMSSPEWSRYMHEVVGLPDPPEEINREVVRRLQAIYRERLPLMDGAVAAVKRLAARWPLGLASSSNRELIDLVLELAGLARFFAATVSSEEVERGKPSADVYLEAARRLRVAPGRCAAVEDSSPGVLSAARAGMRVVAIPHPGYPLSAEAETAVDVELSSLAELDVHAFAVLA